MKREAILLLRRVGLFEAISFLFLLGVAMPLKHLAGMPMAVRFAGLVHGIAFLVFAFALWQATRLAGWRWPRALLLLGAAVIPCGPFLADPWLRREQEAGPAPAAATG